MALHPIVLIFCNHGSLNIDKMWNETEQNLHDAKCGMRQNGIFTGFAQSRVGECVCESQFSGNKISLNTVPISQFPINVNSIS